MSDDGQAGRGVTALADALIDYDRVHAEVGDEGRSGLVLAICRSGVTPTDTWAPDAVRIWQAWTAMAAASVAVAATDARLAVVGPGYHGLAIHPRVGDSGAFEDCQQRVCVWVKEVMTVASASDDGKGQDE